MELTTESKGPCLNFPWNENATGFGLSPGPLIKPLDKNWTIAHGSQPWLLHCGSKIKEIAVFISYLSRQSIMSITYINDGQIRGVLLTSYTAIRPLYNSSPSLKETASLSPEASHAIFSIPWLKGKCTVVKDLWLTILVM